MATQQQAVEQEGAEEEVEGVVEGADETQTGGAEQVETIRLSRRKREQQERDDRMSALEADRTARTEEAARLRAELQQTREGLARMQGAVEQLGKRQSQPREPAGPSEEPIERRIAKTVKSANEALGKNDLDSYHEHMLEAMDLKAQAIVEAREKSRPAPAAAAAQVPQKPAWVTAIEFQYPDVLTHPRGQSTVFAFEPIVGGNFSPEKLHTMFRRARAELGLGEAATPVAPATRAATPAARALHTGITSTGTGARRTSAGEVSEVKIPRRNLEEMMKAGLSRTQAAKAWRESYGDEG
jgi:hypothetical protein